MTTAYEVAAIHADGKRFLIGFTQRKSMVGLRALLANHGEEIIAACGFGDDDKATYHHQPCAHITSAGWTLGFTGRTKLECGFGY